MMAFCGLSPGWEGRSGGLLKAHRDKDVSFPALSRILGPLGFKVLSGFGN